MRRDRVSPADRSRRRRSRSAEAVHLAVVVFELEVMMTMVDILPDAELSGGLERDLFEFRRSGLAPRSMGRTALHHRIGSGKPAKRLSKLRFSCSRMITCLILCDGAGVGPTGVVLELLQPARNGGRECDEHTGSSHEYPPQIDAGEALCQCDSGAPAACRICDFRRRKIATIVAFSAAKGALYPCVFLLYSHSLWLLL